MEGREREGSQVTVEPGHSEPCYATVKRPSIGRAMTSRVQASWLAARGACPAFLHIITMPTIPLLGLKLASISNGPLVVSAHSWPTVLVSVGFNKKLYIVAPSTIIFRYQTRSAARYHKIIPRNTRYISPVCLIVI